MSLVDVYCMRSDIRVEDETMKARMLPLGGKYYGTRVEVGDDGCGVYVLTVWDQDDDEPSDRELRGRCTIGEWRENLFWGETIDLDSGHFESRGSYDFAGGIVDLLNSRGG